MGIIKIYSLSNPSTIIAPIDAGIDITMILFIATIISLSSGSLFIANNIRLTTKNAIKYAIHTLKIKANFLFFISP